MFFFSDFLVLLWKFVDGRVQGEVLVVPLVVAAGILEADRGDVAGFELRPRGHRRGAPGVGVRPARDSVAVAGTEVYLVLYSAKCVFCHAST